MKSKIQLFATKNVMNESAFVRIGEKENTKEKDFISQKLHELVFCRNHHT